MMDVIVRGFRTQRTAGETITPEQLDRLINVNQIRHHLATTAMTTKPRTTSRWPSPDI